MTPIYVPLHVAEALKEWESRKYTGSLELHYHRGTIGKVKEHRERELIAST